MIRVFPRKTDWTPTDSLAFVGDPPLFRPPEQPVRVSVVFTWDIPEGERLARAWGGYYSDVQIGGPAFGDPGGEFLPGRFLKDGVTITSRGCPNFCGFCHVPNREGQIRELPIKDGWIVQDNNLLACSRQHIEAVFEMLRKQPEPVNFNGGFEARRFQPWHRQLLDSIRFGEVWFACDTVGALYDLEAAAWVLSGIPRGKKRCYVLIGRDETIEQAEARLMRVYLLGFDPFAQLYQPEQPIEYSQEWKDLRRTWSRPAAYRARMKTLTLRGLKAFWA